MKQSGLNAIFHKRIIQTLNWFIDSGHFVRSLLVAFGSTLVVQRSESLVIAYLSLASPIDMYGSIQSTMCGFRMHFSLFDRMRGKFQKTGFLSYRLNLDYRPFHELRY